MPNFILLSRKQMLFRWDLIPFIIIYIIVFPISFKYIQSAWDPAPPDDPSNSSIAFIIDYKQLTK